MGMALFHTPFQVPDPKGGCLVYTPRPSSSLLQFFSHGEWDSEGTSFLRFLVLVVETRLT